MRAIQEITRTTRTLRTCVLRVFTALLLLGAMTLPQQAVRADATTFSTTRRQFKVGILLMDSTNVGNGPENPDPFVFYIAESRKDLKPASWEFVNPLAPGVVTTDIRERWLLRDPGHPYQLGQKLTKDMAAYWEVYLSKASIQELVQYDLLYIHSHQKVGFTPADREKLRKVVDAGGVVWVENCGGMYVESQKPFFLEELQFRVNPAPGGVPDIRKPDHPLLNSPFQLGLEEIQGLGENKLSRGFVLTKLDTTNPNDQTGLNAAPNPETLVSIVANGNNNLPFIVAGNYGSGAVIATAGDTGCDINDRCGGVATNSGGNSGAFSGTNFDAAQNEDLKFLFNMVAWGSQTTTDRRNNRRTGASFDAVGAPLVTNFNFDNTFTRVVRPADVVSSQSSPLIVKNALLVAGNEGGAAGPATLRCYDTQPFGDLDGDGNFDEGLPDISIGLPYDEIWRLPLGNGIPSAPVYGSVETDNITAVHEDRVFVSLADGTLVIISPFTRTNGLVGSFLPTATVVATVPGGGNGTYTTDRPAPAPVFYENRVYQVLPNGLVRCVNALTGAVLFTSFQNAPSYTMQPMATPTLGIVRQTGQTAFAQGSNEITNDIMLYIPVLVTEGNNPQVGRVMAYWLGTRNEVQRNFAPQPDGGAGIMNTRVGGGQGGPGAGWYYVATNATATYTRPTGPFLRAQVRVYSAILDTNTLQPTSSAKEQYALGNVSPYYVADNPNSPITPDGKVQLIKRTGIPGNIPEPRPGQDILIAVDYDVLYIPTNGDPPPQNYTQNQTQVGARPNNVLNVPSIFLTTDNNGLFTSALATDDSMLFTAMQAFTGNNIQTRPFASIQAVNEQEGDASGSTSRMRWKFNFFDSFTDTPAANDLLYTATVDNIPVTDIVPLTNVWQFDGGWPAASSAIKRAQPEALRNVQIVGAPVATNDGITYVIAKATSQYNGGLVTVLMAFKTNPVVTLTVPEPFDENAGVTVSQVDLLSDPDNPATVAASSNRAIGPNFTLDGDQARITITNFRVGGKSFSASQSFVVRYTPRTSREERRVVVPTLPLAVTSTFGLPTDPTGQVTASSGGFTPLLFYYVLPGEPRRNASPTLMGEYVYYPALVAGGVHMIAVEARPQDNDPKVRIGFGEQVFQTTAEYTEELNPAAPPKKNLTNHVRMAQRISTGGANANLSASSSLSGGQGTLAINTDSGTFAFELGTTLIADSKRLLEAGADGAALWSMDATIDRTLGGGEEPIFDGNGNVINPPATGVRQALRQNFARPNVARKVASSDYLIADTGNNRVIRTDRGGGVRWTMARFEDPYGLLASGEQTTLNGPTDVQFYVSPTLSDDGTTQTGYEIHYLIADAGNFRIIEVADYYNRNGEAIPAPGTSLSAGDHVLLWTTRTSAEGKRYRFQSLQRFLGFGPSGSQVAGYYGYPYVSAIVSNSTVGTGTSSTGADFTGGAIVNISYAPYNTTVALRNGNNAVPTKLWQGSPARNNEPIGNGSVIQTVESVNIIQTGSPVRKKRISAPIYFEQINLPPRPNTPARTLFLICDAEGAYVVEAELDTNTGKLVNNVLWMFTQADYDRINGVSPGTNYTDPVSGNLITNPPGRGTLVPGRLNIPAALAANQAQLQLQLPRFQPSSIQLLPSGNYLITNSWTGRSALFESGQFNGEVIEVDPAGLSVLIDTNFGDTRIGGTFASFSVPAILKGNTTALPGFSTPNGYNQQLMGNPKSNTGLLEQPLFSVRP